MFNNIKSRIFSAINPDVPSLPSPLDFESKRSTSGHNMSQMADKFPYARPPFLQLLTPDELRASADHNVRPIIVPRDITLLPWCTGYAECVNSGKSEWNEDQGAFCRQVLTDRAQEHISLPYTYFGVFDGHAGYGAALSAANLFHHILHEKLVDCIDMLLTRDEENNAARDVNGFPHPSQFYKRFTKDELIVGALESAFFHMDSLIAQDQKCYRDAGGCTACVSLFINGKMFVANAGDSRAVLCQRNSISNSGAHNSTKDLVYVDSNETGINAITNGNSVNSFATPFSFDHTPETERQRLLNVAQLKPFLLGKYYVAMEYARRPQSKDLGQRILCRQGTMKGWSYKTITSVDLRMPVVTGEGKRSRLLGTLGVTRGFGDHDLLAINTGTQIKPFLTPHPEVKIRDLTKVVSIPDEHNEDGDYGVLVMGTDGLWDVTENEAVARTVFQTLAKYPVEKHRYTMAAQELVARARGKVNDSGHWRLADSKAAATVDDISVIVIPVYQYYKEHMEWVRKCEEEFRERKEMLIAKEAKEDESLTVNGIEVANVEVEQSDNEPEEKTVGVDIKTPSTAENKENKNIKAEDSEKKELEKNNIETIVKADLIEQLDAVVTTSIGSENLVNEKQEDSVQLVPPLKSKNSSKQSQPSRKGNR